MIQNTAEDWQHICRKQSNACLGTNRGACVLSHGKLLGGTSSINNLHYVRGNQNDFFKWNTEPQGEWSLEDFEQYYRRIEQFQGGNDYPVEYEKTGDIVLNVFQSEHFVKDIIKEGGKTLSYGPIEDEKKLGYIETVGPIFNGSRYNMAKAFLGPIKDRPNLFLALHSEAKQILFSSDKKARRIYAHVNGRKLNVTAKKEIIVTSDPINTAKLLQVSGIGPKKELKKLGIKVLGDLSVGKQLKCQFGVPIFVGIDHNLELVDQEVQMADSTYMYLIHRRGPLTTININDLLGFINTANDTSDYPNMEIYHYYFPPNDTVFQNVMSNLNFDMDIFKSLVEFNKDRGIIMFKPTILHPASSGEVLLKSKFLDKPVEVIGNFLDDPLNYDLDILVSGYKYIVQLLKTPAFEEVNGEILQIDIPNCRNYAFCADLYVKCVIRNLAFPRNCVGTARMGTCQFDSVVDETLNVYGFRGLRIVGISAMPGFVSGNVQGTVAAMADKLSEIIKERWLTGYENPLAIKKSDKNATQTE